jgi:hypothetical protein
MKYSLRSLMMMNPERRIAWSFFKIAIGCVFGGFLCYFAGAAAIARGMGPNASPLWQLAGPAILIAAACLMLASVVFLTMGFVRAIASR